MHGDPTGKHRYCDPFACELVEVKHTCSTCGARHLPPAAQKRADLNSAHKTVQSADPGEMPTKAGKVIAENAAVPEASEAKGSVVKQSPDHTADCILVTTRGARSCDCQQNPDKTVPYVCQNCGGTGYQRNGGRCPLCRNPLTHCAVPDKAKQ